MAMPSWFNALKLFCSGDLAILAEDSSPLIYIAVCLGESVVCPIIISPTSLSYLYDTCHTVFEAAWYCQSMNSDDCGLVDGEGTTAIVIEIRSRIVICNDLT